MSCLNTAKKIELFSTTTIEANTPLIWDIQTPSQSSTSSSSSSSCYEPSIMSSDMCNSLQMEIESLVSQLPNLDEIIIEPIGSNQLTTIEITHPTLNSYSPQIPSHNLFIESNNRQQYKQYSSSTSSYNIIHYNQHQIGQGLTETKTELVKLVNIDDLTYFTIHNENSLLSENSTTDESENLIQNSRYSFVQYETNQNEPNPSSMTVDEPSKSMNKPIQMNNVINEKMNTNEGLSKVDILNQIISTAAKSSKQTHFHLESSTSFQDDFIINSNNNHQNKFNSDNDDDDDDDDNDYEIKPVKNKRKVTKNKLNHKTKCSVCGNLSSGYHYGSHTCEACKLFFRRTEKRIRKTGFIECPKKNCPITSENRASCSQCRYKKCIAAGMSMNRSRYGRHTERLSHCFTPNIAESLCSLIEQIKFTFNSNSSNMSIANLNQLIVNFYLKSIKYLTNENENVQQLKTKSSNLSSMNNLMLVTQQCSELVSASTSLSELSSILSYSSTTNSSSSSSSLSSSSSSSLQNICLPKFSLILFCFLFDLESNLFNDDIHFKQMQDECIEFVNQIQNNFLIKNKFVLMLRICVYLLVLRHLIEPISFKNGGYVKRITDLMRSEFALFKFTNESASAHTASTSTSNTNHNLCHKYMGRLLPSFITYKHLNETELDNFTIKIKNS